MARRRTCFSCGQAQSGSGAFCSSCGKPVDVPDLEMLSGDTSTSEGTFVTLARGGSRWRSVLIIGAVVAAIGGLAAFTGNGAKSSTASTTTTTNEPTSTTEATTTTVAPLVPTKLATLPLPGETTGVTLLLLGGHGPDGSLVRSRILDIDRGVVTTLDDTRSANGNQFTLAGTSKGLVSVPMFGDEPIELWQRDGSVRPIGGTVGWSFGGQTIFTGDTMWAMEDNRDGAGGRVLTSLSFRNGERVEWLKNANDVFLVGVDAKGRPVMTGPDRGAYTFDPLTRTFTRLTTAPVETASAAGRVEIECTASLDCSEVFRSVDGTSTALKFPSGGQGGVSLSPDGKHALKQTFAYSSNQVAFDVADTATGEVVVHLGEFTQGQYPLTPAVWTVDGRWLFVELTGGLAAWRPGLSEPIIMKLDGKPIGAFAIGVFPN